MTRRNWWVMLALATALVVAGLAWMPFKANDAQAPAQANSASSPSQASPWSLNTQGDATTSGLAGASAAVDTARAAPTPLDNIAPPIFRAKPNGDLVLDGQTRTAVERVHALYPRAEALTKLESFAQNLPESARRELKDLYQQYAQYDQAVAQTYPPGLAVDTIDEAAKQLDGLHKLRQQYFGAERADALFGQEEAISQQLLAQMRQHQDPKLSLPEMAEQAQEALKKNRASLP
ncbi:MAG: hypothetical protein EOP38_03970 [Rubrivivax sp.]|nr:MAG: hypothetical protein EOP38_03970 [Rubrivivax sp.]